MERMDDGNRFAGGRPLQPLLGAARGGWGRSWLMGIPHGPIEVANHYARMPTSAATSSSFRFPIPFWLHGEKCRRPISLGLCGSPQTGPSMSAVYVTTSWRGSIPWIFLCGITAEIRQWSLQGITFVKNYCRLREDTRKGLYRLTAVSGTRQARRAGGPKRCLLNSSLLLWREHSLAKV